MTSRSKSAGGKMAFTILEPPGVLGARPLREVVQLLGLAAADEAGSGTRSRRSPLANATFGEGRGQHRFRCRVAAVAGQGQRLASAGRRGRWQGGDRRLGYMLSTGDRWWWRAGLAAGGGCGRRVTGRSRRRSRRGRHALHDVAANCRRRRPSPGEHDGSPPASFCLDLGPGPPRGRTPWRWEKAFHHCRAIHGDHRHAVVDLGPQVLGSRIERRHVYPSSPQRSGPRRSPMARLHRAVRQAMMMDDGHLGDSLATATPGRHELEPLASGPGPGPAVLPPWCPRGRRRGSGAPPCPAPCRSGWVVDLDRQPGQASGGARSGTRPARLGSSPTPTIPRGSPSPATRRRRRGRPGDADSVRRCRAGRQWSRTTRTPRPATRRRAAATSGTWKIAMYRRHRRACRGTRPGGRVRLRGRYHLNERVARREYRVGRDRTVPPRGS